MERDQEQERDAKQVDGPTGEPPDQGLAYDPTMTDTDEANIPADSDADPEGTSPQDREPG